MVVCKRPQPNCNSNEEMQEVKRRKRNGHYHERLLQCVLFRSKKIAHHFIFPFYLYLFFRESGNVLITGQTQMETAGWTQKHAELPRGQYILSQHSSRVHVGVAHVIGPALSLGRHPAGQKLAGHTAVSFSMEGWVVVGGGQHIKISRDVQTLPLRLCAKYTHVCVREGNACVWCFYTRRLSVSRSPRSTIATFVCLARVGIARNGGRARFGLHSHRADKSCTRCSFYSPHHQGPK